MKRRNSDPLTRWDAVRILAAAALCVAAVFAFRDQGGFSPGAILPDWGLNGDPAESAAASDGASGYLSEDMTVLSDGASVAEPTPSPPPSVRLNLLDPEDNVALQDPAGEHYGSDSPEASEVVPENDLRIDTIIRKREGALRVLIYHTHTEEAYTPTPDYTYRTHGEWHTQNLSCSIARVGEELAFILSEEYGWEVAHETTDFEPPDFDTAYTRSLQGVAAYAERGETFDLYIDMHRDSYSNGFASNTVSIGDIEAARLRLLVGKGGDFSQKPDWERNLSLAQSVTDRLNAIAPDLAAPIYLSPRNRYNQHVSVNAVLIEVGNNRNTMEEALAVMPFLAEALDAVMSE
ncbi:MAG: stage II sporulation protein P [Oscillospiraceae bacterium]|jgi:stage II sporulation protein P|nr:stage II sporulation protein P [Oscillospiraceae bacterium]